MGVTGPQKRLKACNHGKCIADETAPPLEEGSTYDGPDVDQELFDKSDCLWPGSDRFSNLPYLERLIFFSERNEYVISG